MRARTVLREITPPIVASAWRRRRRSSSPDWEYLGEHWVHDDGPGWDSAGVVDAYRHKLPLFRKAIAAPSPIGVATEALSGAEPTTYGQNIMLEYAYAVARARTGRDHISILDWGGGFGFMSFIVGELFPDLRVDFHVKDVPLVVQAARGLVPDVTFWDGDSCLDQHFDLVTASSSLQYSADWPATFAALGQASDFLFLSRLPITTAERSFVVRQHAYATTYVGWVISRDELLATAASAQLELVREFLEGWTAPIRHAPASNAHRAFLFAPSRPGTAPVT